RHQSGPAARRHGRDRDRVQLARRRAADGAVGEPARLPGDHRGRLRHFADLRRGEPAGRHSLWLPRSAREARVRKLSVSGWIALLFLAIVAVLIALVPLLPGYDPYAQNLAASLLPPGERSFDGAFYLLGTDTLGRDMLSRLALGGQVSLFI